MKLKSKNKYLLCLFALIAAGCIGIVIAVIRFSFFNDTRTCSSKVIAFNYDGIEKGLDPDGAGIDVYKIKSDKVISQALESAGLTSAYAVEDIKRSIAIQGVLPQDVLERITSSDSFLESNAITPLNESEYFPTQFKVSLYNDFDEDISERELKTLLQAILESYHSFFYKKYSSVLNTSGAIALANYKEYDYTEAIEIIDAQLNVMKAFVSRLSAEAPDFKSKENGLSFMDIYNSIDVLDYTNLERISSNVYINVLTKDRATLREYYDYTVSQWKLDLEAENKVLATIKTALGEYEKDDTIYLTAGDTIEKIDQKSSESYDKLIEEQLLCIDEIAGINANISQYEKRISDLDSLKTSGNSQYQKLLEQADQELSALTAKISEWMTLIQQTTDEYYETEALAGALVVSSNILYEKPSILSFAFVIEIVKCAAPFGILVLIGFAVLCMKDELTKSKKKAA